jgi:hypothetical protein
MELTNNKINQTKKLNEILYPRIPPYIWYILGYFVGIISIYSNNILAFAYLFFSYGTLNLLFDFFNIFI